MNTVPDGSSESLEELFGRVYQLAGEVAGQISRDDVDVRLRRVLRRASRAEEPGSARDVLVTRLVSLATAGDQAAWDQLVERYSPLIYAICRGYKLSARDIEDVAQQVWLRLVEQIGRLRQPAALPGWLATTTARECARTLLRGQQPGPSAGWQLDQAPSAAEAAVDTAILAAERDAALRAAVAELPPRCQALLAMLIHDPPYSYQEISARLGIPVGSIGPQRARCMDRLRRSAGLAALGDDRSRPTPRSGP